MLMFKVMYKKTAILTNLCMFGVIFRGHSFGNKLAKDDSNTLS